MKKQRIVLFVFGGFAAASLVFLLLSAVFDDNVAQTEADMRKYEEMASFLDAGGVFVSGNLDVDINILTAIFKDIPPRDVFIERLEQQGMKFLRHDPVKNEVVMVYPPSSPCRRNTNFTITFMDDNTCKVIWK